VANFRGAFAYNHYSKKESNTKEINLVIISSVLPKMMTQSLIVHHYCHVAATIVAICEL